MYKIFIIGNNFIITIGGALICQKIQKNQTIKITISQIIIKIKTITKIINQTINNYSYKFMYKKKSPIFII